jgi:uncharacterized protein involved in exopolysaccharide biosynthesis
MDNNLLRKFYYYLEVALTKPLYGLAAAVITFAAGSLVLFSLPRSYYSEALVIVQSQQMPTSLVSSTVANERMQIIEQRVLARENLLSLVNKFNLFPQMRAELSDTKVAELVRNQVTIRTAISEPSDQYASSSSVRIGFKYDDARLAAAVASELVETMIDENKRLRVSRASETAQFLTREVNEFAARFEDREKQWAKYIADNNDALPSRIPAFLIEVQEKERELTVLERAITALNEEVNLLEARLRLGIEQSDEVSHTRSQLTGLQAELRRKLITYSEAHPDVRTLMQTIEALKVRSEQQASRAGASSPLTPAQLRNLPPELSLIAERIAISKPRQETMQQERDRLLERVTWLKAAIFRAPQVETQIAAMEAEKESMQSSMDEMKRKLEAARLGERLEQDQSAVQIQVLETPEVPRYPTGPRRLPLLVVVAALSGLAGLAGIYVADALDRTIRGAFDLDDMLEGQTLVMIPRWGPYPGWLGLLWPIAGVGARAASRRTRHPVHHQL